MYELKYFTPCGDKMSNFLTKRLIFRRWIIFILRHALNSTYLYKKIQELIDQCPPESLFC